MENIEKLLILGKFCYHHIRLEKPEYVPFSLDLKVIATMDEFMDYLGKIAENMSTITRKIAPVLNRSCVCIFYIPAGDDAHIDDFIIRIFLNIYGIDYSAYNRYKKLEMDKQKQYEPLYVLDFNGEKFVKRVFYATNGVRPSTNLRLCSGSIDEHQIDYLMKVCNHNMVSSIEELRKSKDSQKFTLQKCEKCGRYFILDYDSLYLFSEQGLPIPKICNVCAKREIKKLKDEHVYHRVYPIMTNIKKEYSQKIHLKEDK